MWTWRFVYKNLLKFITPPSALSGLPQDDRSNLPLFFALLANPISKRITSTKFLLFADVYTMCVSYVYIILFESWWSQ